jgi:hypothetical protein
MVIFNFCDPFVPANCPVGTAKAYSFIQIRNAADGSLPYQCIPYSSDSKTSYYSPLYVNNKGQLSLNLTLVTVPNASTGYSDRSTDILLDCEESQDISYKNITVKYL